MTILWFLLALAILVTVHEYGHFYVARRCGVKVIRFSVGFGKPLYTWIDKQGTEFTLAAIPLGGYVKMLDEREDEVEPAELPNAFTQKSVWQRIAVVVAGPVANFLLAFVIFWILASLGRDELVPIVGEVAVDSLAARAGVEVGQEIVAVDSVETKTWQMVNQQLISRMGESGVLTLSLKDQQSQRIIETKVYLHEWLQADDKSNPLTSLGLSIYQPVLTDIEIAKIAPNSVAELAGLQVGDRVIAADGIVMKNWEQWVNYIKERPEQAVTLTLEKNGQTRYVDITPELVEENGSQFGRVGVYPVMPEWPSTMIRHIDYNWWQAFASGAKETWETSTFVLSSVKKIIFGEISTKHLSGVITIAKVAGQQAKAGFVYYLSFLALLSVSLGVFNLLPIPVLDGGHLFFYLIEAIKGSPVPQKLQMISFQIGFFIVAGLMLLALYNDVMREFINN
jgi:regulator of sigma E protease